MKNDERAIFRLPKLLKKMAVHLKINIADVCRQAIINEIMRVNMKEKSDASRKSKRHD